jgi:hypothetical protein
MRKAPISEVFDGDEQHLFEACLRHIAAAKALVEDTTSLSVTWSATSRLLDCCAR